MQQSKLARSQFRAFCYCQRHTLKRHRICNKPGVIEKIDHKNINLDVDFMSGKMSSTENLVIGIWEQIEKDILNLGGELAKIKLVETENNFVEYFGGKEPF